MHQFKVFVAGVFVLCTFLLPLKSVHAQQYIAGVDYVKIAGIPEGNKPILREFFSYNCGHCYRQDAFFEKTTHLLGKDVQFERTPIGGGRASWVLSQQAYYLAQKFNVTKQVHNTIFKRIHEQNSAFTRPEQLKAFFVSQGIEAAEVDKAMASADAKLALMNYDTQAQLSGIRGVPSLVVNGQYLIKAMPHSAQALAELITYLSQLND
ncbi:thiol:disulfide interchange protein DsbA/DsbL [Shewanella youngdeokensis]|uniref:Thiol:disulfide interchange protein n=1 Tax=Shewanella youngdeokensis TaxID=2999068 RepID=A0ABZ0JUG3_9GAMM|nr:thiol:disulfide interchange protein DsbA/DsbL [Shewanella sp. DAU334]